MFGKLIWYYITTFFNFNSRFNKLNAKVHLCQHKSAITTNKPGNRQYTVWIAVTIRSGTLLNFKGNKQTNKGSSNFEHPR